MAPLPYTSGHSACRFLSPRIRKEHDDFRENGKEGTLTHGTQMQELPLHPFHHQPKVYRVRLHWLKHPHKANVAVRGNDPVEFTSANKRSHGIGATGNRRKTISEVFGGGVAVQVGNVEVRDDADISRGDRFPKYKRSSLLQLDDRLFAIRAIRADFIHFDQSTSSDPLGRHPPIEPFEKV